MIAVSAIFLVRPARSRPVPARVIPGDDVASEDGLRGVVVRLDGAFALIDAGDSQLVWARSSELMTGDGSRSIPGEAVNCTPLGSSAPSPGQLQDAGGGLARFAELVWTARRTIVWGWLIAVLAAIPLAGTAEQAFTNGGFLVRDGEAIRTIEEIRDEFHQPIGQQQVILRGSIDQARTRQADILGALYRVPHVLAVTEPRISRDGRSTATTILFDDTDDKSVDSYDRIIAAYQSGGYSTRDIQVAGTTATFADTGAQTKRDLATAERIGTPLALLVLLFVFGTVVAALVPLVIGLASVVLTLAILHVFALQLELSVFVMNIASMLGFGLGIDYSLLGVSRFREELESGRTVREATITTIVTSGRAAAISGIAVLAGVAALAAIPLPLMFAIALGGMVVVAVTVLASLTLLPATLGLLGHRVERWRVRRRRPAADVTASGWYRLTHAVMRRPGLSIFCGIALLVVLASPTLGARLDVPHDDVLPPSAPSNVAQRTLDRDFGEQIESPVFVILHSAAAADVAKLESALLDINHIRRTEVIAIDTRRDRALVLAHGDRAMAAGGPLSRAVAADVNDIDIGVTMGVSGQGAGETEFLEVIKHGMPRTLLLMFTSTIIILTIAFRSLTLPLKAIALDTLSILASLGAVIAVFQNGLGIELLGGQPIGYTESTIPIILFCLLFGLSMDYEVFMLAKVTELYQAGYDDREATARGVAMTAPLVTGAALILIVIGVAFACTQIILVKQIGFGMAVALALDASVVRVLLLPATMRWLGAANWWLPAPLRRRVPRVEWAH